MIKKIVQILYILVIILMVVASLVEKTGDGTITIYGSWWFVAAWCLLTVAGVAYISRRNLYKRPATFLLHVSMVVILIGALTTHLFSEKGAVEIREGETVNSFVTADGKIIPLPFNLTLKSFRVINYPGTDSAMDFVSVIHFDKGDMTISMNNIGKVSAYRFYQASYDSDMKGTVLSVCHDPWGIGITYVGYILLLISFLLLLFLKNEGMRAVLQKYRSLVEKADKTLLLTFVMLLAGLTVHAEPKTFDKDMAEQFGELYVYYNGRICPISTLAHDLTLKLHGSTSYKNLNADQILSGWMFFPTSWIDEPYIKIKSGAKNIVGTENKYVSYMQFMGSEGYKLENSMNSIHRGENISGKRDIIEADEKMNILRMLFNGELMKPMPYKDHGKVIWASFADKLPNTMPQGQWLFIRKAQDYCTELAVTHQDTELKMLLGKIKKYQIKTAQSVLPDDNRFKAEIYYNKVNNTLPVAIILACFGFFMLVFHIKKTNNKTMQMIERWSKPLTTLICVCSLAYLVILMSLRGYISGYLPMATGYETMQFLTVISLIIALIPTKVFRQEHAMLMASLSLFVSLMDESNPQLTQLMPVLHSPLLSIHVCIIMLSYALLGMCMIKAAEGIVSCYRHSATPEDAERIRLETLILLYPAEFMLGIGIFIGAVWANVSWGEYWSWDPKETWALITFMIYAIPLHTSLVPATSKAKTFHIYMLLAFLTVVMTYFGVNFFLTGMHSYANV